MVDKWTNPTTASLRGENSMPLQQTFSSLSTYLSKLDDSIVAAAGAGVTSITAGSGISVSAGVGAITVANTGVTSLAGTGSQIAVSAATGGITLSLPSTVSFPGRVNITAEKLWFGAATRQMINLWSSDDSAPQYGIGVQSATQYFRTGSNFAWYSGGTHNDAELNAGGGTRYAYMNTNGMYFNGWVRPTGQYGIYFEDYGGGFRMTDSTWIRIYNGKNFWAESGTIGTNGGITIGRGGTRDYGLDVVSNVRVSGRHYSQEWIQFDNYTALYSPLNDAHFYPNNGSYGAWRIHGERNTWKGLEFDGSQGGNLSLMMDTNNGWGSQYVGVHNNSYGWIYQFQGRTLRTNAFFPIGGNNTGQVGAWYGAEGSFNIMYSYGYVNYSDVRTKHSVESLQGGLDFIKRLRPVKYKYIYENRLGYEPDEHGVELPFISSDPVSVEYGNRYRYGFIAQEVKQALEETGNNPGDYVLWGLGDKEDPESTQQLEYLQFIGPLTRAVQELAERVEQLEVSCGV